MQYYKKNLLIHCFKIEVYDLDSHRNMEFQSQISPPHGMMEWHSALLFIISTQNLLTFRNSTLKHGELISHSLLTRQSKSTYSATFLVTVIVNQIIIIQSIILSP